MAWRTSPRAHNGGVRMVYVRRSMAQHDVDDGQGLGRSDESTSAKFGLLDVIGHIVRCK